MRRRRAEVPARRGAKLAPAVLLAVRLLAAAPIAPAAQRTPAPAGAAARNARWRAAAPVARGRERRGARAVLLALLALLAARRARRRVARPCSSSS
jgi:hypothetical protein